MKHISDLANISCIETARQEKEEKTALEPLCAKLVDQIFVKFALICREYDALYEDKRRENAEKLQWTLAFTKNNLKSKSQIQHALNMTERHKYGKPPQLGQFLEWCNPSAEDLGLPSIDQAYAMSIRMNVQFSDYSPEDNNAYTVIAHALNQIGRFEYRTMKCDKARKVFEHYYSISCKQFVNGELKPIDKALPKKAEPHPSDKARSDEARKKAMDAIRNMI